ncbi:MAG TPA: energy-coupling factor transporter ATPase [Gammaproteobacteria bacterium]|nr:energy-coupling factor transporter ATPase [Gammaproteobacteria bacterium]
MTSTALALDAYSFWFKPQGGRPEGPAALADVSFEIDAGSFVLILGRSGSGKSTLALNMVGIYPDYFGGRNQGRMLVRHAERGLINRREIEPAERFKLVNMLFQNPEDQIVTLTVEEEVGFALENYLYEPAEIHRRIDHALELVGLSSFRTRETLHLSGGEKQRVALAAMLALEPSVLILDEPTSNLDPAGTAEVLATIDHVREQLGLTIMVIEHEVDEVFERADAVLLVDDQHAYGPFSPRDFLSERGLAVRDEMGLWIPQAAEVALELRRGGIDLPGGIPLNGDELVHGATALGLTAHDSAGSAPEGRGREPATPEPAIEVRGVSFAYGERPVLENVSFTAHRGELLAIVGQNGSGKSTLASLFNGIAAPDRGAVLVDGIPTTEYEFAHLAKRVAYIFQVPEKQFVCNTVYDEIAHGLRALGASEQEVEAQTLAFLESVRLADRRDASPYVLSHGQKRRLSVAAMVVGRPEVVVLDEPTFGQDFQQARNLMELLRSLADEGAAVVFITHDMRLVAEYADRAAVLSSGEIIFDGKPFDLFAAGEVLERARLKAPAVYGFSRELLGEAVMTTAELSRRLLEAVHGGRRTVI